MTPPQLDKNIGDLLWIPAGAKLWRLLDEDKKIPKYRFQELQEPKYLLITKFADKGGYIVSYAGIEWNVDF